MIRLGLLTLIAALGLVAQPAMAQSQATASGTMDVQRGLNISTVTPMQFGAQAAPVARGGRVTSTNVMADAPAVIAVTGDPGRLYRVRLPQFISAGDGGGVIETLSIRSRNSGEISRSRVGRMDANGHDLLTIGGRLHTRPTLKGPITAMVPLSIDYE